MGIPLSSPSLRLKGESHCFPAQAVEAEERPVLRKQTCFFKKDPFESNRNSRKEEAQVASSSKTSGKREYAIAQARSFLVSSNCKLEKARGK